MIDNLKKILISSLLLTAAITPTYFFGNYLLFNMYSSSRASVGAKKVFYVSNLGNNSNPGTIESPFLTIGYASGLASPGDEIHIMPGTYRENVIVSNKQGSLTSPLLFIGESLESSGYPVIDGGDTGFSATSTVTKNPAFTVLNSSWIQFERLKIINSTDTGMRIDNSHYVTVRRNIFDYHNSAVLLKARSSHVLFEYNETYQSYPDGLTWTNLKGSNWEGGAFKSDGGAGMNVIRYNYFHRQFNSIFLTSGYKTDGKYYDANVWIYRNRFEDVIDDPYEPESYVFNNHFFNNTLINTHRLFSVAPANNAGLGPVFIYNNMQLTASDPTREAGAGRKNSLAKVDLSSHYYSNGVYVFNNSLDISSPVTNGYAIDFLSSTVNNFFNYNNAYRTYNSAFSKSSLTLNNSEINFDMNQKSLGYTEPNGFPNSDPLFVNASLPSEDLRISSNSPAKGKSKEINISTYFAQPLITTSGADLGAFQSGEDNFRQTPNPVYVAPPGGEYSNFPDNTDWGSDLRGGYNPLYGPSWIPQSRFTNSLLPSPTIGINPSSTPPVLSPTPQNTPFLSPSPTSAPTTSGDLIISKISAKITKNTVTVRWITNLLSSSKIIYSRQSSDLLSNSTTSSDLNLVKNHALTINYLTPNTKYWYKVVSTPENGKEIESAIYSFKTRR